jgi:hypothetical protein
MVCGVDVFLDIGCFFDYGLCNFKFALALVRMIAMVVCCRQLGLIVDVLVINDGWLVANVLHGLRFLFEIVAFVYILNDLLVLCLNIFDFLFQILKLLVQGLDLLDPAAVVASVTDRLGYAGVGGVQLGTHPSISVFHLIFIIYL